MRDDRLEESGPLSAALDWADRRPGRVDAAGAAVAAALLGPSSVKLVAAAGLELGWLVVLTTALVALHAPMAIRRRYPRLGYAVSCAGMLLLTISPYLRDEGGQSIPGPLLPSALLFFVLLYTVSEQLTARWAGASLGVALLGGVLVLVRVTTGEPWWSQVTGQSSSTAWLVLAALIVAGSVGAYGLGRLRRTRRAYVAELQERARRTELDRVADAEAAAEAERRRIAREMHDVVSHSLAVMISQAEGGRMLSAAPPTEDGRSAAVFATIADTGRAAMGDMRALLGVLRDDAEPSQEVDRAPQPGLNDLPRLFDSVRSAGCAVTSAEHGTPAAVTASVSLVGYRLVQEALTNAVKHAGSTPAARVVLEWRPDQLAIEIVNDCADTPPARGGAGLVGMRERVEAVGGRLTAGPVRGLEPGDATTTHRWHVTAVLPLSTEGAR